MQSDVLVIALNTGKTNSAAQGHIIHQALVDPQILHDISKQIVLMLTVMRMTMPLVHSLAGQMLTE